MHEQTTLLILKTIAHYFTLQRADIQRLCFPTSDKDARSVRRYLNHLLQQKLINKTNGEVVFQDRNGAAAPVYYPSRRGCEFLHEQTGDAKYRSVCTLTPTWQWLTHWLSVARFHILLDLALSLSDGVTIENWLGEWDVTDPSAREPEKRFRLFTLVREHPRLVMNPDASFVIQYKGYRRGYYLELDRATSGVHQIANSKTPGYAAVLEQALHGRHFPGAETVPFRVLLVTTTAGRRDALRAAFAKKAGAQLWRFVAQTDLTPETAIHTPIVYACEGDPQPLVKRLEGGTK